MHAIKDSTIEKRLERITRVGIDNTTIDKDNYNKTFGEIANVIYKISLSIKGPMGSGRSPQDFTNDFFANPLRRDNVVGACNEEFVKFNGKPWRELIASRSADNPTTAALKKMWTAD